MALSAALPMPSNSLCPTLHIAPEGCAFLRFRFGGYATSAPPLAAVAAPLVMAGLTGHLAASGTVDNINDSVSDVIRIFL